jgi:dsDNA-specific endonuclease/ATPase MutS2
MFEWLSQLWRKTQTTKDPETPEAPYDETEVFEVPIEAELDLHTFSPKEIPEVTKSYLEEAHHKHFLQVRIIHGKGKGVQREIVHSLLKKHPLVQSFQLAPPEQGGWGATIVWLIPNPGDPIDDSTVS